MLFSLCSLVVFLVLDGVQWIHCIVSSFLSVPVMLSLSGVICEDETSEFCEDYTFLYFSSVQRSAVLLILTMFSFYLYYFALLAGENQPQERLQGNEDNIVIISNQWKMSWYEVLFILFQQNSKALIGRYNSTNFIHFEPNNIIDLFKQVSQEEATYQDWGIYLINKKEGKGYMHLHTI